MNINKKTKIVLFSESQKDDMLDRLEKAQVDYRIKEESNLFTFGSHYSISINASDMKKLA